MGKKRNNKVQLKRISLLIKPYTAFVAFSFVCALLSALLQLLVPVFCGKAIDNMTGAGKVDFQNVILYIVYILITVAVTALAQQFLVACNNKITFGISKDLRDSVAEKLHKLPLSYLDSHPSGDLLSRMISDVETFSDGMLMGLSQLFTGMITIIGTLIIMFYYNFSISIIVVFLTPLSLFLAAFISGKTHRYFTKQALARGKVTAFINEAVDGAKVIKSYNHEEITIKEFDEINNDLGKAALKATFFSSLTNPSTRMVNNVIYAGVILICAMFSVGGAITIGQISVFLSYASQYAKPFNEISGVVTELQNAFASIDRVFELLDCENEVPDKSEAVVLENAATVQLRNVSFSYKKENPLIKNISLDVKAGQRIAVVGPTGCGKTTLINLLMRFYDVDSGEICVNNINVKNITRNSLRRSYGMVLQDTWLKSGTVKQNIAYGKPDATEEEIISAAKTAHADSFIRRLPNGYDTVISENGDNISAGQKQLLCIARVMLSLPPMLILDEATSSIDTRTEMKIQSAFSYLMKGRTTFIVAHRLSTIREADLILVMKDGNIIEQGTHERLLKNNGFYYKLYNSQFAVE